MQSSPPFPDNFFTKFSYFINETKNIVNCLLTGAKDIGYKRGKLLFWLLSLRNKSKGFKTTGGSFKE
jgi:hypothetical protein